MKGKGNNLPKRLVRGGIKRSQEAKVPDAKGGKGQIATNWKEIHWTPIKLSVASTIILAPISCAIVLSFKAGNSLVGIILIGLLVFMGLMYWALRY
ncbi:MAG: hypothetical protein WBM44_17625, partial [Waterburya sp.]